MLAAIDDSLRRLGTDYVDLYQIHRWDPETPIEETLTALHDIVRVRQGALHRRLEHDVAGSSPRRFTSPTGSGWTRFVSMQNHYNLVYREEEREMLPLCREEGIGVIPWSPLARGFLAGNRAARQGGHGARPHRHFGHALYYAPEDFSVAIAAPRSRAREA